MQCMFRNSEFTANRTARTKNLPLTTKFPLTLLLIIYSTAGAFNSWLKSENKEYYRNCSVCINSGAVSNTAILFNHD